jgi:hypothetical protein
VEVEELMRAPGNGRNPLCYRVAAAGSSGLGLLHRARHSAVLSGVCRANTPLRIVLRLLRPRRPRREIGVTLPALNEQRFQSVSLLPPASTHVGSWQLVVGSW